ncbi:MAG TPA: tetratricopeptide repeat protein [Streptosporangiaceae bacterium]|nr:tetratricopeptide repeat protein [Streptosporangiaceae bacterium]
MKARFVTRTATTKWSANGPYPGARPFQQHEQGLFFGRASEADTLAELWRTNYLTIMYGHTGAGKSSLLSAALIPRLQEDSHDVLAPGRLLSGWTYPRPALPPHNPYTQSLLASWSPNEAATSLAGVTIRQFVARRTERHGGTVFAVIDQAEELFASSEPGRQVYSRQFLRELAESVQESSRGSLRLHLLLSCRESVVDLFTAELGNGAQFHLRPLDYDQALDAVTRPLTATWRSFAAGAPEKLVRGLMTSKIETGDGTERSIDLDRVEPALLQAVCSSLWKSLPAEVSVVSEHDIRRYGEVDAALASYCGQLIALTATDHDMSSGLLQAWLVRTFVTTGGTRGTAYEGLADTAGVPNAVLRALEDGYLLVAERRAGAIWYQLLSDRLIEPLRHATDSHPPLAGAEYYTESAGRALALGEFSLAQRYAGYALHGLPTTDFRHLAEVYSLLGNLASEQDRLSEAENHYRSAARLFEAVRNTPAVASQLAAVGQMLLAQGKPAAAVEELSSASDRAPHDLTVQTQLAVALWVMGQSRTAISVLTGVLAIDGGNQEALQVRGEILADLGDSREALHDLERVVHRERPSTRAARGLAKAQLGEPGAEKEIEGALEDAPRNGPVLLYAARAKALAGDKATAITLARHALNATDPPLPEHQHRTALEIAGQNLAERY